MNDNSNTLNEFIPPIIRQAIFILLPILIAFYLFYPLFFGEYGYPYSEQQLYKSFMSNFIDTLKNGELPLWNEYIGSGSPALLFGHYPISQNTLFYMLFGVNDNTYYFNRVISMAILLLGFVLACKLLKISYLYALIGALVYFCINFVCRIIMPETVGNLYPLYPVLVILVLHIVVNKDVKYAAREVVIFNLVYILWLSGGHLTYEIMPLFMLSFLFVAAIAVFHYRSLNLSDLIKYFKLYLLLFIVPLLAVAYQYYFIYDVISVSNRLKEGLIVSPFEATAWRQFVISLQSSSYIWFGLFLTTVFIILKLFPEKHRLLEEIKIHKFITAACLAVLVIVFLVAVGEEFRFESDSVIFYDYITILNASELWIALFIYLLIHLVFTSKKYFIIKISDLLVFMVFISILSYYLFSPENIIGDVNGYDYDLFQELSPLLRTVIILGVLFSMDSFKENKIIKIIVLSFIMLYLMRSHFTILILRFIGIVWYATRDGSIYSLFFAILFIFGIKNLVSYITGKNGVMRLSAFADGRNKIVIYLKEGVKYGLLVSLLILLVMDSHHKFYQGTSHKYIYPLKAELVKTSTGGWVQEAYTSVLSLTVALTVVHKTEHFYRMFSPENHYLFLGGMFQNHKIHEAAIYDSSISKEMQEFYDNTILENQVARSKELKDVIPYFLFTRHVHAGIGLTHKEIGYGDFFMFSPKHLGFIKNQNIEFWWDLAQVKYLLIGNKFAETLKSFASADQYKLLKKYPKLGLNLYEITKEKNYSKYALLPLAQEQSYDEVIANLNAKEINKLKRVYADLLFPNEENEGFTLLKIQNNNSTRYYEIKSDKDAIFIDFESWNHNWKLLVNGKPQKLEKAFQMFKGIRIQPGINKIELTYELKYFKELFFLGMLVTLGYVFLLLAIQFGRLKPTASKYAKT